MRTTTWLLLACLLLPATAVSAGKNGKGQGEDLLAGLAKSKATAGEAEPVEPDVPKECSTAKTRLTIRATSRPAMLKHDEPVGNDEILLRSNDGQLLLSFPITDGLVRCLGVDREAGRYILGSVSQVGAWLPLVSVFYVTETHAQHADSAFVQGDFIAMATRTSPDGHYVAFIGGKGVVDGVYVLDTRRDLVRHLGKPPMPPPVDSDFVSEEPFAWGTGWADGYGEIESSVLYFKANDRLVVTYGRDSAKRRAKKRKAVEFDLGHLDNETRR